MVLKKHYSGHSAGDEVRWFKDGKLSSEKGVLKGYDEKALEWVIKTHSGDVRALMISDEKERTAYWQGFEEGFSKGFAEGLKCAREQMKNAHIEKCNSNQEG